MIVIGSDHGGFALKEEIKKHLEDKGVAFTDVGSYDGASVDYPDIAKAACEKIVSGECDKGLLFCGTGVGISIAANKIKGIRACCCSDAYSAKLTRQHNNANVLCMGQRVLGENLALLLLEEFLKAKFEGGRHQRRVDLICSLEQ